MATGQTLLEHVGHGHELDGRAFDRQCIDRRARPTSAAADEHDANRTILGRMDVRDDHAGQCGSRSRRSAVLEKLATRSG